MALGTLLGKTAVNDMMSRSEFGESDSTEVWFENYIENIEARIVNIRVDTTNFAGSTLIWGNSGFGIWGSFYWGNTGNTSFILGNSSAGVLGTNLLGTNESASVRVIEQAMWIDYSETFNDTTYVNSTYTTGSWMGNGSVTFMARSDISFFNGSMTSNIGSSVGSITLV